MNTRNCTDANDKDACHEQPSDSARCFATKTEAGRKKVSLLTQNSLTDKLRPSDTSDPNVVFLYPRLAMSRRTTPLIIYTKINDQPSYMYMYMWTS